MIVYNLRCDRDHEFEAWFSDSAAFDSQSSDGKLVCPVCDTTAVSKAPMAPAIAGTRNAQAAPAELKRMRKFMTGLRKYVEENAEYVGTRFPEEARKIHYGECEERPIYGEASLGEAKELIEEGIDVAPLPPKPDEAH
ncbi:MAG: DUF1178 family protein [Alphaproteobacteria bacterium]|nr:DUF1178 family protein [Alphaproteobacteria bacterium]